MGDEKKDTAAVRTRFAPSPTGYQHVGGVRTALFAWLVARQAGGQFVLRIEDTDKTREVAGSERHLMDSLRWLGLDWDEGPDGKGAKGPYRQSDRLDIYISWAKKLVESGRAYADPYTAEELEAMRGQARADKKPFLFRDFRPEDPPQWRAGRPLRFKSNPKPYDWEDEVMGSLSAGPQAIDDFIIIKADGYPTYNFAHIVDDHLMQISHVIRSQEFLASVPKFLNLYEALGLQTPKLATLPYVMAPDGRKKLSKRDGAKDVLDYKKEGYLPKAVINFLATLGWNDGTEQEIFSREELLKKFSLDRVQRSGAIFDEHRLTWMNGHYIRRMKIGDLMMAAEPFLPASAAGKEIKYKKRVLKLVQERLKYFAELSGLTSFFFEEPAREQLERLLDEPPDKQLAEVDKAARRQLLEEVRLGLQDSDFSLDDIKAKLNGLLEQLDTRPGVLFALVRIAVTGEKASPEIFGTLELLGKEVTLSRLKEALSILENKT